MERLLKEEIKKQGEQLRPSNRLDSFPHVCGRQMDLEVNVCLFLRLRLFGSSGIDVDQARKEEERVMLQDATAVLAGGGTLTPHPNTKATALHVASAKGYIEVLK